MKYHSMGSMDYLKEFIYKLKEEGFTTKVVKNKGNLFALYYYKK